MIRLNYIYNKISMDEIKYGYVVISGDNDYGFLNFEEQGFETIEQLETLSEQELEDLDFTFKRLYISCSEEIDNMIEKLRDEGIIDEESSKHTNIIKLPLH